MRQQYGYPLLWVTVAILFLLAGCSRGDNQVDSAIRNARIRVQIGGLTEQRIQNGADLLPLLTKQRRLDIPPDVETIRLCIISMPEADDKCEAIHLDTGRTESFIELSPNVDHVLVVEARNHRDDVIWEGRETVNLAPDTNSNVNISLAPIEIESILNTLPGEVSADLRNALTIKVIDREIGPLQDFELTIPPGALVEKRKFTIAEVYNRHVDMAGAGGPDDVDRLRIPSLRSQNAQPAGLIFSISVDPPFGLLKATFSQPIDLVVPHDTELLEALGIMDTDNLRLFQFIETERLWYPLADQQTSGGRTIASLTQLNTGFSTSPVLPPGLGLFTLGKHPPSPLSGVERRTIANNDVVTFVRTNGSEEQYKIHVLENDYDVDGDELKIKDVRTMLPKGGSATMIDGNADDNPDDNIDYILYIPPKESMIHKAELRYEIKGSTSATANVTVYFILQASDYEAVTKEGVGLERATRADGVLAKFPNLRRGGFQAREKNTGGVSEGMITLAPDGTFRYQPKPDFNGDDEFPYEIVQNIVGIGTFISEATIRITVTPVNDPPKLSILSIQGEVSKIPDPPNSQLVICRNEMLTISTMVEDADIDPTTESPLNQLLINLQTMNGLLSLEEAGGLNFEAGRSTDVRSMRFHGSEVDINKALAGITWKSNRSGLSAETATITLTVDDQGHIGGLPLRDEVLISILFKPDTHKDCASQGGMQVAGAIHHGSSSNMTHSGWSPRDDVESGSVGSQFIVDSTDDIVDVAAGDSVCASLHGSCTLRAALQEANALSGIDVIVLPMGVYRLGGGEYESGLAMATTLDITDSLTIIGAGKEQTVIDGGGISRLFEIMDAAAVEVRDVTIRNGLSRMGGGIVNRGMLTLIDVAVRSNTALFGGALFNVSGSALLIDSLIENNQAMYYGGGIVNTDQAELVLANSLVSHNTSYHGYGGGVVNAGNLTIFDSSIHHNRAQGDDNRNQDDWRRGLGGGLVNHGNGTVRLDHSHIVENVAVNRYDHTDIRLRGSGVFNDGTAFYIRDSVIAENGTGKRVKDNILDQSHTLTQDRR